MKIMFSAGEASGDTHAASVAKALKTQYPDVEMLGMGGAKMEAEGVKIVYNIDQLGIIGIIEIVKALPKFFALRDHLKAVMMEEKPDVLVCVDYPGFNMRLMKVAKALGIPVVYYIAPTIWIWHNSRGKEIAEYVDRVASIFPMEAEAYKKWNAPVTFVGNPLLDIVKPTMTKEEAMEHFGASKEAYRILLMPGSRAQEVASLLDVILLAAKEVEQEGILPEGRTSFQFFLPRAHTIPREVLEEAVSKHGVDVKITEEHTYDVMQICDAAVAASGTATLETALMGLPTILLYRVAPFTYYFAKVLVGIKTVGLPNIIMGRNVIPEVLQHEVTPDRVKQELIKLMTDRAYESKMRQDLQEVKHKLGEPGAVERVAKLVAEVANEHRLASRKDV